MPVLVKLAKRSHTHKKPGATNAHYYKKATVVYKSDGRIDRGFLARVDRKGDLKGKWNGHGYTKQLDADPKQLSQSFKKNKRKRNRNRGAHNAPAPAPAPAPPQRAPIRRHVVAGGGVHNAPAGGGNLGIANLLN